MIYESKYILEDDKFSQYSQELLEVANRLDAWLESDEENEDGVLNESVMDILEDFKNGLVNFKDFFIMSREERKDKHIAAAKESNEYLEEAKALYGKMDKMKAKAFYMMMEYTVTTVCGDITYTYTEYMRAIFYDIKLPFGELVSAIRNNISSPYFEFKKLMKTYKNKSYANHRANTPWHFYVSFNKVKSTIDKAIKTTQSNIAENKEMIGALNKLNVDILSTIDKAANTLIELKDMDSGDNKKNLKQGIRAFRYMLTAQKYIYNHNLKFLECHCKLIVKESRYIRDLIKKYS